MEMVIVVSEMVVMGLVWFSIEDLFLNLESLLNFFLWFWDGGGGASCGSHDKDRDGGDAGENDDEHGGGFVWKERTNKTFGYEMKKKDTYIQ